ncbi:MAG: peptidyl-prolyl cis-trans isomerase [Planctomycetes bacterium]|nr:peptidyl-prolyl cis-trans isomerase [Planctomycetota bacterium]
MIPSRTSYLFALGGLLGCLIGSGCKSEQANPPPPDAARKPQLRSETELAAERSERIQRGEIVENESPLVAAERKRKEAAQAQRPPTMSAPATAIQGDILLVNKSAVTVDEVLYALREKLAKARETKGRKSMLEQVERLLRTHIQQEVGSLLVYEKATGTLEEPQKQALDQAVDKEVNQRIAKEFEGSAAKFGKHLEPYHVTLAQYKERVRRQLVVRSYTREILMPRVSVRREELFDYYKNHSDEYRVPGSRELLMIEAPFDAFLPEGTSWSSAPAAEQARARLKARKHILEASAALGSKPFADVATEFSKGPHKSQAGSWGEIGSPLKPPFDKISAPVFSFSTGQHTEPIELEGGWYIAGCGKVELARDIPFAEAQPRIRDDLREERFNKLANEYVLNLAAKSTIAALDAFFNTAMQRATAQNWPNAAE